MKLLRILIFALTVFCAVLNCMNARANDVSGTTKAVREYALTSANDFPLRDPQDWRLLGSNDDGRTWVTLDQRRGESFGERHQRRLFHIENRMAFNIYRLQIDCVRDPAGANAVQLAEIEMMGEREKDDDATPIFADRVTAQGENPPFESSQCAFDGRLETKWLDYATEYTNTRSSWIQWQYTSASNVVVTNIQDLLSLRSRANDALSVKIDGLIVGISPSTDRLCFMDATGHLEVRMSGDSDMAGLFPGQHILLTGKTAVIDGEPDVVQPNLTSRAPLVVDHPQVVALGEPMSTGDEWQWVEVEGQISFCSQAQDPPTFELDNGGHQILVHVLSRKGLNLQILAMRRLVVRGLRQGVLNNNGELVTGILWVAGPEDLNPAPVNNNSVGGVGVISPATTKPAGPLTTIAQIGQLSQPELQAGCPVKLQGVVIEALGLFLQQGTEGIELRQEDGISQLTGAFGDFVAVEGVVQWNSRSGPKVNVKNVKILGAGQLPPPAHLSWNEMTSGKPINRWIEVDGIVRSTDGSHLLLACDGGPIVATIRFAPAAEVTKLVDAKIRIRGVGVVATDDRAQVQGLQLIVPSLDYVEVTSASMDPFDLPAHPLRSLMLVKPREELVHRVKIEGTVTLRRGSDVFLQDDSGSAMAVAKQDVILGQTVGRSTHWLFWQLPNDNQTPQGMPDLQVGEQVQAVGFLETGGESPVLTEALFRAEPGGKVLKPVETTIAEILTGKPDSSLISLECLVLGREVLGTESVLQLEAGQKVFRAILAGDNVAFDNLMSGSRVRVTGVCQIDHTPYPKLGKNITAFQLLMRTPNDLLVLERPPWWNIKHTFIVAGALVFITILAASWIRTLRRQVDERTKRLKREIEEHKITEWQLAEETRRVQAEIEQHMRTEARLAEKTTLLEKEIEERKRIEAEVEHVHRELVMTSRRAGMAEVATGVLHNVGNVLNSVNVLASLIVTHVKKSKVSSLAKLASLLGEHRHDLGHFVTEDPNGKQVPAYVEQLAGHLANEQTKLLERVESIADNVQHIKEIVAVQQSYAGMGGGMEEISLQEIVEDSLRMHNEALTRHQVDVIREFEKVPPVTADRHKILQIIFNLLANAKYACEASGRFPKQLTVRICKAGQSVRVSVKDNGIGISPENLSKIFIQGFSTRKGGHGFGLHSSILVAEEMGGSLRAQSDGPGQGATFTLEIPTALWSAPKPELEGEVVLPSRSNRVTFPREP